MCIKLATRKDGVTFPCGQCANCRINKRRDWQSRLLLEAASHASSAFVTLTFRDTGTPPICRRSDLKYFFRALRIRYPDLRHFSAAEYGSKFGRAHYHAHLFSAVPLLDHVIRESWPYGTVDIGNVEPASLDYVLGYLLKDKRAPIRLLDQRYPPFRMFSPGIGKLALQHLLVDGCELPREFKVFGRKWPIGRYLRDRAKKMGYTISERESVRLEAFEAQTMRAMLKNPSLSTEQIAKLYEDFVAARQRKLAELQKRAIRDAYRQNHGHVKGHSKNETF